jgi:AbrB family looped-hinge helix DNA binding protein
MQKATISPDFQIEIPPVIREKLNLKPGQQMHVTLYENRIELIPVQPPEKMRGFLRGMSTDFARDQDRF